MNENEKKTGDWKKIVGGILLIAALFMCIKFIFWGLEQAIPPEKLRGAPAASASQSTSVSQSAPEERETPSFCVHCGKALPESFEWGQFCPWCGEKAEP